MATRRAGRDRWDYSPTERRPRGPAGQAEAASPPVLSLSHFCTKPFLCFGNVRLGASRTLALALDNPNAEEAAVTLPRFPAAARGFSVWPRAFALQPKEKIVISVNWTPLKQGRVREIVTFLVNDVLKHEVILLGNAEEPKKKKSRLWDTIKKKKSSAFSGHEKKSSNIQNVNKTFSVSQTVDRVRSPLQACENLAGNESCSPIENNSLILEENKIPISPISPIVQECHGETCLPLSVRRSTTYSSLHASVNRELLKLEGANVSKDLNFDKKVVTETSFNSMNNVNGQIEEDNKLTLTPNYSSTLNITQSQGHFLSPDSFVNNSHKTNKELELVTCVSPDTFMKDNSRPVHLESKPVHEIYRTFLSPDSFVNDNYGLKKNLESEIVNPILSPDRFVNDNMAYLCTSQQTCKLSPSSNENSQASQSPQRQRKNEVSPRVPECQRSKSPKALYEEPRALEMKANGSSFTEQNQPKFSAVQDLSGCSHNTQLQRRPVLSATVTKMKPSCIRENPTESNRPKARRCLHSVAGEGEKETDDHKEKGALQSHLPVIDLVGSKVESCTKVTTTPPSQTALAARKRKSEGNQENGNVTRTVTELTEVQDIKRIHFSPVEFKTSTIRKAKKVITPASKLISNREKLKLTKKTESLGYKTPNSKTSRRTKRIVPVAQSNLTFIKPLKTDIPRHPMPFAAKNMFYDERWKEKQQQGFTWWLNFILTPDDFTVKTNISEVNAATLLLGVENQHKLSVPRAPTKDEMSLRAYTARCRLNRLRRAACRLFTSEKMVKAIKKLEIEIEAKRLIVRKDRHLWKDVGERQKVLNWLLSYNPLWLRIGLETVYGELIALEDNSDVTGLALFILNRLLWNPDIAAEYRHPTVPHLYRDGHEEALSKFTLKKLLLLVCFLDYAKISRLIDHDPCLFCKDAEFKASKEILLAFSRDFLSGEGDLSRHLGLLGLPVNHVQTPFDEFDFAVTNLAVDLQCGVRLVRAMELLTHNWDLSKRLRVPAISRLQKVHNVDLALQVLKSRGIQLNDEHGRPIVSKDIVDRHREKTLALLWKIAFAFQVDISLNLDQLKEEINFLKLTWSMKKQMSALLCHPDTVLNKKKDRRLSNPFEQYSESIKLLMDWVNAVCAFYNKKVENFTVSFSDGRVLCYLVHHYHPCYVPFASICQRTTQTVECAQTGSVVLNSSSDSDESCLDVSLKALDHVENTSELAKELLENEKKNFQLVRSAVRDLGGIPAMIHHSDMSNTIPDEKVVITYLSFLCARLLDLRRETRAARLIQTAWRKFKLKADQKRYQERDKAARIIQSAVTNFLTKQRLKKVNAALVIQKYWRRLLEQRKLLTLKKENLEKVQNKSALVIQKYWRRYSTRKKFLNLKYHSIILQSRIRMVIAVASYKRCLRATVTIQRHWRACLRRNQDQQRYEMLKSSALKIQYMFRRWKRRKMQLQVKAAMILQRAFRQRTARKRAKEDRSAAAIQSWYRTHKAVREYIHIRSCVVIIQTGFRCFHARKLYRRKKESVLTIQRHCRAYLQGRTQRAEYLRQRAAAIRLQAAFRAMRARLLLRRIGAACVLQSWWRMRRERFRFLTLKKAAITLQAHVRRYQQVQQYEKMRKATLVIQGHFRARLSARQVLASYQRTRSAATVLQAACRGMQARRQFRLILRSVVKLQSHCRAYVSRKRFLSLRHAAVRLQSLVKMKQSRRRYSRTRAAALFIQRWYRSVKAAALERQAFLQQRAACVRLQALVRGHLVRKRMRAQRKAAAALQAHFRMRRARLRYLRIRTAALVLQRHYRAHQARANRRASSRARRAATRLQAAFRGHRARRLLRQQSSAALTIQAAFRGYRARATYRRVLQSAVRIQRWYRTHRAAGELRTRFLKTRTAVVCLQAAYRGWKVRQQSRREREAAAAKIRPAFRRRLRALRRSVALLIQHRLRAWRAGRERRGLCAGPARSCHRVRARQQDWRALKRAVRLIRVYYRASGAGGTRRPACLRTRAAAVVLQAAYRAHRAAKAQRERDVTRRRSPVVLQAAYTGAKARQPLRGKRRAARGTRAARRADGKEALGHGALTEAVTGVQAASRDTSLRGTEGERQAARAGQKRFEGSTVRQRALQPKAPVASAQGRCSALAAEGPHAAAFGERRDTQRRRPAAAGIQASRAAVTQSPHRSQVRVTTRRKRVLTVQTAVRTPRAAFRGRKGGRSLRTTLEARLAACGPAGAPRGAPAPEAEWRSPGQAAQAAQAAAATVPTSRPGTAPRRRAKRRRAALRPQPVLPPARCPGPFVQQVRATGSLRRCLGGWRPRRRLVPGRKAVLLLQSHRRAPWSAERQREAWLHTRSRAAVLLQARVRGLARTFPKTEEDTLKIQAAWRTYTAQKPVCEEKAACKIQAWYRCWRARKEYLATLKAVQLIQGGVWAKLQRARFLKVRASAIIIQRRWRATLSGRRARDHFLMMKKHRAACLIQANFRGYKARQRFRWQKSAALTIQRYVRAWKSGKWGRTKFVELKKSAVVLQALIAEQRARTRLLRFTAAAYCHLSALRIQRAYRRRRAVKNAEKHVNSVICIQRWFRARLQPKKFVQTYHSIIRNEHEVQEGMRKQNRAASIIQKAFRRLLLRKKQETFCNGIIKIQALWRGYSWRKKNDCTKTKAIRNSLQMINREIREENKLYRRTAYALHHLLTYKHLSAILEALKHLEVVTRLSPLCCENMAQSGAISKIFVLIRSCNRSVPCMEVIGYAVQVLLNVAKYEKTTSAVYDVENWVDTLLELLQMYREKPGDRIADKSGSIFTKTCCLLAVLLKTTHRASDVRNRSKVVDRVHSLYKLTARKHRMNTDRVIHKQNKNSSISTPLIPETPVRTRVVSRLQPGWVLRRDNMEITRPLQAVRMVMDTLGIPC